jgi:hypothetical protein
MTGHLAWSFACQERPMFKKVFAVLVLAVLAVMGWSTQRPVKAEDPPAIAGVYSYEASTGYLEGVVLTGESAGYEFGAISEPNGTDTEQAQILWVGDGQGNVQPVENTEAQITWSDGLVVQITWSD